MARDGRTQLFFIFCVLFGVGCMLCDIYVETGKSHTFKPNITGKIVTITWKFEKNPGDVIKLVDWDPQNIYWYSHEDRASLNTENGELTIKELTKEDNGVYEVELEVNDVLERFKYKLTVMGQGRGLNAVRQMETNEIHEHKKIRWSFKTTNDL